MKKVVLFILLFASSILSCFGCACNKDNDLKVYRNLYDQDVTTFNYLVTNEYQNVIRIANLVDGLVEHDKYGNIVPSIAKSWKSEIVNNKQVWTFYLKDNVYWSDYKGNKYGLVTAHDFVTTFKYSFNYEVHSDNFKIAANLIDNGLNYYYGTLIKHFDYNNIVETIEKLSKDNNYSAIAYYQNIKNIFDECNASNKCSDDFNNVGVKAINNFELQYTLSKPCSYFLSSLTYYSFLPVNEEFLNNIGINNFGTSKKNLLYNGAYLLNDYSHSSKIEYIKNHNYWDKDNVFIDKLIFTKSLNYSSYGYMRLAYEAGNLDEFVVTNKDAIGWKKYVIGENGKGTPLSPVGNNTYVIPYTSNFTTFYLLFNQNRVSGKYTTLTQEEINIGNKAMQNTNFRKALSYGIKRNSYFNNETINNILNSIVPFNFIFDNSIDYTSYLIKEFALLNSMNIETATSLFKSDAFFNENLSEYYLNLALDELNINSDSLPIKIEYTYYKDEDYKIYDKARIKEWNKILNGCYKSNCTFDKVEIVYNDTLNTINEFENAFNNKEFNLSILGLYPDYNDPTTYLNAFSSTGDFYNYLNHSVSYKIDSYLDKISNFYLEKDLFLRYEECARLEYYILFEENLILPLSMDGTNNQIIVSNLVPYEKMNANYGLSAFKFKYKKIRTINYTQEDIMSLKEEYLEGEN